MNTSASFRLLKVLGLAALLFLGGRLSADIPQAAAESVSPGAVVSVSPSANAGVPLAPSAGASAATVSTQVQISMPITSYAQLVSATVLALGPPLDAYIKQSGQQGVSVAAGGFRELVTGERSPLCDHLDRDLTDHLRDDTPYGVPSTMEMADAWVSVGGNAADMAQPYTLRRFGRLLSIDTVVSGDYLVQSTYIILRVRLLRCSDGETLWSDVKKMPVLALDRADLNTYANSAPAGYGAQVSAPPPPLVLGSGTRAGKGAGYTGTSDKDAAAALLSGVQLESDVHETEFSVYRVNFGAGYEFNVPVNTQFRAMVRNLAGPYVDVNWADIVRVEFYGWYQSSLATMPQPISDLFGYGMTASLALPIRLGHYWVAYAGLGGRFESINVSSPLIPAMDGVTYGNNSFYATAGLKAHRGSVGVDANAAYGFLADYSSYFTARLGLYYEYNFD